MSDSLTLQDRLIIAFKQNAALRAALYKIAESKSGEKIRTQLEDKIFIARKALFLGTNLNEHTPNLVGLAELAPTERAK
jgi:hypothetical protein